MKKPLHIALPIIADAVVRIADRWPEPTHENCQHPNSHVLLDLFDDFLQYETNPRQVRMYQAIKKIAVTMYDTTVYYRRQFDYFAEGFRNSPWTHEDYGWPIKEKKEETNGQT